MELTFRQLFRKVLYAKYETIGDDVDYCFQEEGKTLYILFQWSASKSDWINNFAFKCKPYKDMEIPYKVHGGFLKCWKAVEDIVIEKITEIDTDGQYKYNTIYCAGYSHGGALTMLCHECVWFHRPDIRKSCYSVSFDGPRVYGGYKVKPELRERWVHFFEVRNDSDIVTHVPFWIMGFTHVGNILHIGRDARYGWTGSHYDDKIMNSLKEIEDSMFF